jgi:hypothetical protein
MKKCFLGLIFLLFLCNCSSDEHLNQQDKKRSSKIYTDLNSAIKQAKTCNKLLLITITNGEKDINACVSLIQDKDIMYEILRKYVVVFLKFDEINALENSFEESNRAIPSSDKPLFIISNTALYFFGQLTLDDKKDFIIERLGVGDGP